MTAPAPDKPARATDGEAIRALVDIMARAIVDYPDKVEAHVLESEATVVIDLRVAREDVGKVIGRKGAMAEALRTLVSNAGTKLRKRALLNILE